MRTAASIYWAPSPVFLFCNHSLEPIITIPALIPPELDIASSTIPAFDICQSTVTLPGSVMSIGEVDVQIALDSLTCPDTVRNIYHGVHRGQPARFTERRQLCCHTRAGVDVCSMLIAEAIIRIQHQTPRHVPVVGIHRTRSALGSRTFLVEAPYQYTELEEHLRAHPDANRSAIFMEALEIVDDIHAKNLVHGSIRMNSFVVDSLGKLCLSGFEHMRVQDPTMPFCPTPSPSVGAMAFMAPELLLSFKTDGIESLNQAADVYAIGCFAYELFTGMKPFAKYRGAPHIAQQRLITAVADNAERPERPASGSEARTHFGLTNDVWDLMDLCWAADPASRPTVFDLLQRAALLTVV